jgi:hypothetical protein
MIKMTIEATPEQAKKIADILSAAESPAAPAPVVFSPAPAQLPSPPPLPVAPAPLPVTVTMPVQPPVQTPAPVSVPVAAPPTYDLDSLSRAAAPLMAQGRQVELVGLLKQFGVASLTQLPPTCYGDFATALRGLGAQI